MKKLVSFVAAGLVILAGAIPTQAQEGAWEFGVDGGFVLTSVDIDGVDNTFDVSLPFQFLRAGVFVTPQISIEPMLGFERSDLGDDDSLTSMTLLATGLYHFSADRNQPQFFLQAGGGLDHLRLSFDGDSESDTQWLAGAGAGVKVPVLDRVSLRFSALYLRAFESDVFPTSNQFRGHMGLSFHTR